MLNTCKERAYHCPTCSLELSRLESELLRADGCIFHYPGKVPYASLWHAMLQGLLDAIIFNVKVMVSKRNIETLDLQVRYQVALGECGVQHYRNLTSLRQKMRLIFELLLIKPIPEVINV